MPLDRERLEQESRAPLVADDLSEDALAQRFTSHFGPKARFCASLNRWYFYEDGVFVEDTKLRAFDEARRLVREAVRDAGLEPKAPRAQAARKAATVAAVVRLAAADPAAAIAVGDMDADLFALATPDGVLDLRTGSMRPHSPTALHTKCTAATPRGECPSFRRFLAEATGGDAQVEGYLRRLAGYSLTGDTREQHLTFIHGPGGTGKSEFIRAVSFAMGTYAKTADMALFTERSFDDHPATIARLAGARLVTSSETEAGRRLAVARVKALTGGDRIEARFMRQDPFEFVPQLKLIVAGNHRPRLAGADSGLQRRIHLVPFVTKPAAVDKQLGEKLRQEAGGILAWALEGCLEWQSDGLNPPPSVLAAAAEYMESQDTMGQWCAERLVNDPTAWTPAAQLFAAWSEWAVARGEKPHSARALTEYLRDRGHTLHRRKTGNGFLGLRLHLMPVSG